MGAPPGELVSPVDRYLLNVAGPTFEHYALDVDCLGSFAAAWHWSRRVRLAVMLVEWVRPVVSLAKAHRPQKVAAEAARLDMEEWGFADKGAWEAWREWALSQESVSVQQTAAQGS